jgi:hypothetical protein
MQSGTYLHSFREILQYESTEQKIPITWESLLRAKKFHLFCTTPIFTILPRVTSHHCISDLFLRWPLLYHPEDGGGGRFTRNLGKYLPDNRASHARG